MISSGRVLWLLPLLIPCAPAVASDRADLEAKIASLTERVAYLEQIIEGLAGQRSASADPSPGTGREASFAIGGRVKLDMVGNSVSVGGTGGQNRSDVGFLPSAIPLNDETEDHQLSGNARDSRIWINASTPTKTSELGAYIELDFGSFDNSGTERISNSHNPRMRHAYASYNGLTVGQTTSTFDNLAAFPELNDSGGPVGVLNVRQPLIRYSTQSQRLRWSVAAEQPETTVTTSTGQRLTFDDDQIPDLVGRVDLTAGWGELSLAALLREIRVDDTFTDEAGAYGFSVSGRWYVKDADNLRFALNYGEGIGRYVSYNAFNDAVLTPDNELETIPVWSGFLAYQRWWNTQWRSNIALGYARAALHEDDYTTGLVDERFMSSHLNLLWSPIPDATFGIEWLHGRRELMNGTTARLNRLQFTSLYKFRQ